MSPSLLAKAWILLLLACALPALDTAFAQAPVFIKEVVSREYGIHVGGIQTPEIKEVVSREVGLFIGDEPVPPYRQVVSREFSLMMADAAPPPPITGLKATPSPTGGSVTLDWSAYNPWAVRDVKQFAVYMSDSALANVTGLTPYRIVPADQLTTTLTGLGEWQDRFFAVVAVDALDHFDPVVNYAAAYVLMPEVVSREVGLHIGAEPVPPYRQVVSREVGLTMADAAPPPRITGLKATPSPTCSAATLDWSTYNPWAVRDVKHFAVYLGTGALSSVEGLTPALIVPGDQLTATLSGLAEWQDRSFAVVAVDALDHFDPVVNYATAYVLMPEVVSREVGVFVGQEPPPPPPVFESVTVPNPGFELPDFASYTYWGGMSAAQKTEFAWTSAGNGGNGPAVFNNGDAWGYQNVPEGTQGLSLQGDSSVTCTINLTGGRHTLSWSAASRGGQVNPYVVRLDEVPVSPIYSTSNPAWQHQELSFDIATAGSHTLTFAATNTGGGDNSVAIDAITLGRYISEGTRPFSSYREVASREVSVVVADDTVPAPVTGVGSGFTVNTSVRNYSSLDLDWSGYNEWAQRDVRRYRVYLAHTFFDTVDGLPVHQLVADGSQQVTLTGLVAGQVYYAAVVAEDWSGAYSPIVYSVSAQASVAKPGDVTNVVATPGLTRIDYRWEMAGAVGSDLFVDHLRVYFNGATTPVIFNKNVRTWTATGLTPGYTYPARFTAVDIFGTESDGVPVVTTTPASPSPLAYWRFEEGAADSVMPDSAQNTAAVDPVLDSSGNGNELRTWDAASAPTYRTSVAAATVPRSLAPNTRCLQFTPNDAIYEFNQPMRSHDLNEFTIEASFAPDSLDRWQTIIGRDGNAAGSTPSIRLMLRDDNDRFMIEIVDDSGTVRSVQSLNPATAGQWHHLIATYDGTQLALYVRGPGDAEAVLQGATTTAGGVRDMLGTWTVGRGWNDGAADWVNGRIDEVRVTPELVPPTHFMQAASPWQQWRKANFTAAELLDPALSGELADPDGDGLANLAEYGMGLSPRHADPGAFSLFSSTATSMTLNYPRNTAADDVVLSFEVSTTLKPDSWQPVAPLIDWLLSSSGNQQLRRASFAPVAARAVFYRLKVTKAVP